MERQISRRGVALVGLICIAALLSVSIAFRIPDRQTAPAETTEAASFPQGTPIQTPDGPVQIELLRTGQEVLTYNAEENRVGTASVLEISTRSHSGDVVDISVETADSGGSTVSATGRHPFWVVSGDRLSGRPEAPGDGRPLTSDGRWVAAADLKRGDMLLSVDGLQEVRSVAVRYRDLAVFDLRVTGIGVIAVGSGAYAGDVTRDELPSMTDFGPGGGGGGCFVGDTLVVTDDGAVPIEAVRSGSLVWSYDPVTGESGWQEVRRLLVHDYTGDIAEITVAGARLVATGNHPFWVDSGISLTTRPPADDLGAASVVPGVSGRWVSARDLRSGDIVRTRSGQTAVGRITITSVPAREVWSVYNLEVGGSHTYSVGSAGIVVHNKGESEAVADEPAVPDDGLGLRGSERVEGASETGTMWDDGEGDAVAAAPAAAKEVAGRSRATESGLSAGYSDDNLEYGAYLRFLAEYALAAPHVPIAVDERIVISVRDSSGKTVPNAIVAVRAGNRSLVSGRTYSDGRFLFFPSEYGNEQSYVATVEYDGRTESVRVDRRGPREIHVTLSGPRTALQQVPLDVLFVLDTTGSMGEEIDRLTQSIEIIHLNLTALSTNPLVRFGMVLYKDRGDEYTTRTIALTPDIQEFQFELQKVYASGGGDYPEDLQAALGAATRQIDWDPRGVRLAFVITDAPPQLYPDQTYTYADAARAARDAGIRLYTVGTGGMDIQGEYPLRQLSQYTGARYIFLTYGESGESEGGVAGSVSHHTGANYETDKLESIIIRFAKEELQYLTDTPVEISEPYFTADPIGTEERDATLRSLFSSAVSQLLAYSSWAIPGGVPTAVIPFHSADTGLGVQAEYLSEQLLLTMRQDEAARAAFTLVERRDMQAILEEIEFQLSGLAGESSVTRVGEFLGAELLLSGSLYENADDYELFIRLLRVETGEVLAVTKAVIDGRLVP